MAISHQLTQIAGALEGAWNFQRVVIKDELSGFSCTTQAKFWSLLPTWCWMPQSFQSENRESIGYFYEIFGRRRIEAISQSSHLNLAGKYERGQSLTRWDVKQLFLGLGEVYYEDVHDLFLKVKGEREVEGRIDTQAQTNLGEMRNRDFNSLSKEEWDRFYACLVPFETIETLFLNHIPRFDLPSLLNGDEGIRRQRIYLCEKTRRMGPGLDLNKWKAWASKSMLKKGGQKNGLLIPHPEGYFEVYGQLEGGGASILLLKGLQEGLRSIVKAQGTRTNLSKDSLLSVLDDFSPEIGLRGYQRIEQSLIYLLGRNYRKPEEFDRQYQGLPVEGFRRCELRREMFDVLGFSLGCAQMQHFIQRHPDVFSEAFFICAPGISRPKCMAYRCARNGPVITYAIEYDDRVNRAGQCKLGYGSVTKKVRLLVFSDVEISREELKALLLKPPSVPESVFWLVVEFLKAFICAHGRHTAVSETVDGTMDGYETFEMSNYEDARVIQWVLSNEDWEDVRLYLREIYRDWKTTFLEKEREAKAGLRAIQKKVRGLIPSFLK